MLGFPLVALSSPAHDVLNIKPLHNHAALLVENGKFLLSAKRTRRTTSTEYVISLAADDISRSSNGYIGKLRYAADEPLSVKFIICN